MEAIKANYVIVRSIAVIKMSTLFQVNQFKYKNNCNFDGSQQVIHVKIKKISNEKHYFRFFHMKIPTPMLLLPAFSYACNIINSYFM